MLPRLPIVGDSSADSIRNSEGDGEEDKDTEEEGVSDTQYDSRNAEHREDDDTRGSIVLDSVDEGSDTVHVSIVSGMGYGVNAFDDQR